MAKIARLQHLIVTRLLVAISQIVANVVLLRVKIAHQLVMALIVLRSLIAANVLMEAVVRSVAARVTVIRVQRGVAMIVPRRVVSTVMQRLRNVANLHRVLSAATVLVMMTCRFSVRRA